MAAYPALDADYARLSRPDSGLYVFASTVGVGADTTRERCRDSCDHPREH